MSNSRFNPHSPEVKEKCFQLFKTGKLLTDIAPIMGVPLQTLRSWSSKGQWKARVMSAIPIPGRPSAILIESSQTEVEAIAGQMTLPEQQEDYKKRMSIQALRVPAILEKMTDREIVAAADKISKLDTVSRKALHLEENKPSVVVNVGLLATGGLQSRAAVVIDNVHVAGELPGSAPEAEDAEFTAIEDAVPEPVQEKVATN